jgi:hypothetical protein
MAVTSANLTGQPPATTVTDAAAQLGAAVAVYLDGGPAHGTEVSTIIDCTGDAPMVLRAGAISQAQIDEALAPAPEPGDDEALAPAPEPGDDEAIELPPQTPPQTTAEDAAAEETSR